MSRRNVDSGEGRTRPSVGGPVLELPSADGQASLRGAVDTALRLIAFEMWSILDRSLRRIHTEWWEKELADREDRPIRREDASAVVGLLLSRTAQSAELAREAFGRSRWERMYRQGCLQDIRKIRNKFAHPDGSSSTTGWVDFALSRLARSAKVGELDCYEDIQLLSARVRELAAGKTSPPSELDVELLGEEIEKARRDAQDARGRADVAEAEREQAADEKLLAEVRVREVQDQLLRLASEQEQSGAQVAELQQALTNARKANDERARRLEEKERELNEREELQRSMELRLQRAEGEALASDALLAEESASLSASGEPDDLLRRSLEDLRDRLQRLLLLPDAENLAESTDLPEPGEPWPYSRGEDVWRLSKVHRKMVRLDDDADLASVLGSERAVQMIDQFLAIRPTGGRVWVDSDNDAVTYVDRDLVYLGRLEPLGPLPSDLRPGDSFDDYTGRSYSMTMSGQIQCRSTGGWLEEAVGLGVARAVAQRIQRLKPTGGRFRVSVGGIASAYVDGQWVFVTEISPEEWFPGHLD